MVHYQTQKIASKLDKIANISISSVLIPVVTKNGISIGNYYVVKENERYIIKQKKNKLYQTFTKSAALIVAGLLHKQKNKEINPILEADNIAFKSKNDLEIFKYHYELAIKNKDYNKEGIMIARFEQANEKYQIAKQILKQSYSKLF